MFPLLSLTITEAEAWVLFDLLTRFCEREAIEFEHRVEWQALWRLQGHLEVKLGVKEYPIDRTRVEAARAEFADLPDEVTGCP